MAWTCEITLPVEFATSSCLFHDRKSQFSRRELDDSYVYMCLCSGADPEGCNRCKCTGQKMLNIKFRMEHRYSLLDNSNTFNLALEHKLPIQSSKAQMVRPKKDKQRKYL